MSVKIHGIECRNCFDVDWARRVEAEDKKKEEAEAAKKAKEAVAPAGSTPDIVSGPDQSPGFDRQPATILDGALKGTPGVDASGAAANAASAGRAGSTQALLNVVV